MRALLIVILAATVSADLARSCSAPAAGNLADVLDGRAATVSRTAETRQMRVVVPIRPARVELCSRAWFSLVTPVVDPLDRRTVKRSIPIERIAIEAGKLILLVSGPVAEGAVVRVDEGAFAVDDVVSRAGELTLPGIDVAEATFWFKALEPSLEGQRLLGTASYPAAAPLAEGTVQPSSPSASLAELRALYDRLIKSGFLARTRADELIDTMRDVLDRRSDRIARIFAGPDGAVEARLLAATLANAGTVLDGAIDAILFARHAARRPIKVSYEDVPAAGRKPMRPGSASVWIAEVVSITLASDTRKMPLPALATLIGHEALHQDSSVGLPEEMLASLAQFTAYAQHVLADPAIVRWGTDAVRSGNVRLASLINSGAYAYPSPGLGTSPLLQRDGNVFPGSRTDWKSFSDLLRRRVYPDVRDTTTAGNDLLDSVATRMTGAPHKGLTFSEASVRKLGRLNVLTWEQWLELAHILRLQLPAEVTPTAATER